MSEQRTPQRSVLMVGIAAVTLVLSFCTTMTKHDDDDDNGVDSDTDTDTESETSTDTETPTDTDTVVDPIDDPGCGADYQVCCSNGCDYENMYCISGFVEDPTCYYKCDEIECTTLEFLKGTCGVLSDGVTGYCNGTPDGNPPGTACGTVTPCPSNAMCIGTLAADGGIEDTYCYTTGCDFKSSCKATEYCAGVNDNNSDDIGACLPFL